jgi:hypothetical protein
MERFCYEIVHTDRGSGAAALVRGLIAADPMLAAGSAAWPRGDALPAGADIYVLVVVVTDDLASDPAIVRRVADIVGRGFPVLPVVPSLKGYDFKRTPLPALAAQNAVGLDTPAAVVDALLHHGGLRRFGSGGQVFISYARRDGSELARLVRDELQRAGFRAFLDEREIAGGSPIQDKLHEEIGRSDLVLLVDSRGAADSPWVAEELDMARVVHVPVIAVTPSAADFEHSLRTPHVTWKAGDDADAVARAVVHAARRLLARKVAFRDRVARVLRQVSELLGWHLVEDREHWVVRRRDLDVRIECCAEPPSTELVMQFCDRVGRSRGALVGGTRGYSRDTARAFALLGREQVRVTPLPRVASTLSERLASRPLAGRRIFLSAALPDRDETEAASYTLGPFVVTFVQTLFTLGATIVFGGHPSVLPLVHKALCELAADDTGAVELFQAASWRRSGELPPQVRDVRVFRELGWHGDGTSPVDDLAAMRDAMITPDLHGAVFVGGKVKDSTTELPGVIDEYRRFRAACPTRPAFLLGLARGAAARLLADNQPPLDVLDARLTDELRDTHDPDLATALIVAELLSRSDAEP